jgi:hypothetical protein
MSEHTPGPWGYQENSDAYTHIVRGQNTTGTSEANARLIAAAPELYEELENMVLMAESMGWLPTELHKARMALRKAEARWPGRSRGLKPTAYRAQKMQGEASMRINEHPSAFWVGPRQSSKSPTIQAERISKREWMDLYYHLLNSMLGGHLSQEAVIEDAKRRLRVLKDKGLRI